MSFIPVLAGQLRQRHDLPEVMDQGDQLQPVGLAAATLGRLEATAVPQIREDLQRLKDAQLTWEDPKDPLETCGLDLLETMFFLSQQKKDRFW